MNKSLIAALVALVVLALAVFFGLNRQQQFAPVETDPAIADFADKLADAQSIILAKGEARLTLEQRQEGWGLKESGGYPVDLSKLRKLVADLEQSQRIEPRSDDPAHYPNYGLASESLASYSALDQEGNPLVRIRIGSRMTQLDGHYALLDDNPQVWVVGGLPQITASPRDWLKREITDIAAEEIQHVRLADGALSDNDGTLVVDQPGDNSPNQPNINQVASALSNLRLLDVRSEQPDLSGDTGLTEYTTKDGLVLKITHGQDVEGKYWASFNSEAHRDRVVARPLKQDDSADDFPQQAQEERFQQAQNQSETLNQRLGGYWLQLPSIPGGAIAYTMDDLVQPPQQEKTE